jgi:hypothetical protein
MHGDAIGCRGFNRRVAAGAGGRKEVDGVRIGEIFSWQRNTGEAIAAQGFRVYPESLALVIRLPFAGFVWNYPVSVLVEREGKTKRMPIIDANRAARWAFGLGLMLLVMAFARQGGCESE